MGDEAPAGNPFDASGGIQVIPAQTGTQELAAMGPRQQAATIGASLRAFPEGGDSFVLKKLEQSTRGQPRGCIGFFAGRLVS